MTPEQRQSLLDGTGQPFDSTEHRRNAWEQHKAELIGQTIAQGIMPAAWWEYDATEPRRAIKHGEYWLASKETVRGIPVRHWIRPHYAAEYAIPQPEYETEKEYLQRLGIW